MISDLLAPELVCFIQIDPFCCIAALSVEFERPRIGSTRRKTPLMVGNAKEDISASKALRPCFGYRVGAKIVATPPKREEAMNYKAVALPAASSPCVTIACQGRGALPFSERLVERVGVEQ